MAYQNQPAIPLNKLGEFIYGSDAKKRSILKTLKFPSTFKSARYSSPKSAVIHFLVDEKHDLTILQSKRSKIEKKTPVTDWAKNNQRCCLQAIDDLIICTNTILSPYLQFRAQHGLPKKLTLKVIEGVLVHVNPDIILLAEDGVTVVGAIRLVFSKSRPISTEEGQVIASMIRDHLGKIYKTDLKEANCVAVDVFHRRCIPAIKDFKNIEAEVKKACVEIMRLWPNIN